MTTTTDPTTHHHDAMDDIADAATGRLETIHIALFREAGGEALPPSAHSALAFLGDDAAVKRARRDAAQARSAVETFRRTEGAQAKADKARAKCSKEAPALREQIEKLQEKLRTLEQAPVQHERDAEQHEQARKAIRQHAPVHIRKQHRSTSLATIHPLQQRLNAMQNEHNTLDVLCSLNPTDSGMRHIVESQRSSDGTRPWIMKDAQDREVVNPQAWLQHLHAIRAHERRDELAGEIEALKAEVEQAEAEVGRMLDYWLSIASETQ